MSRSPIRFVTIGTGNAYPQAYRGPTSTLIRYQQQQIVVDLGSGALQKLCAVGAPPSLIDAVFLTHAHIDHLSDLQALLFGIAVGTIVREQPLAIYASSDTLAFVHAMRAAFGRWLSRHEERVIWHEIAPAQRRMVGALLLETATVQHTDSSVAYKFSTADGRSLAIPGDTGVHPPLEAFVRGVDALIIECGSDPNAPVETHLTPEQLRALLIQAEPKTSFIVHRPPALYDYPLEAFLQEAYSGNVVIPNDLDAFEI